MPALAVPLDNCTVRVPPTPVLADREHLVGMEIYVIESLRFASRDHLRPSPTVPAESSFPTAHTSFGLRVAIAKCSHTSSG